LACDFFDLIRGRPRRSRTPVETGFASIYTSLAAKQSAETGKFVKVRAVQSQWRQRLRIARTAGWGESARLVFSVRNVFWLGGAAGFWCIVRRQQNVIMSKLYYNENGNVTPILCEELTTYRRARKFLKLAATKATATLYVLARSHEGNKLPLRCTVNGKALLPIRAAAGASYSWYAIPVAPSLLKSGDNRFEFWTDATAMNAWSLAIEGGHPRPHSFVSDDGGATWRNRQMGYLNVLNGEYVARVRLAEGQDPPPAKIVWENPSCPRVRHLRQVMPAMALGKRPLMERVRAITGWLASSWEHTSSGRAPVYAPWDAETILAWGKAQKGHSGWRPVVMCVHYAVAFVSCAQAAGIPARCAVLWGSVNGWDGHFVTELWFDEYQKWVMVDPNADAIFFRDGEPMSLTEIQQAGTDLSPFVRWGKGTKFQRQFPHIVQFVKEMYLTGRCFRHRSVWARTDFLSRPELTPPGHGALAYCETGLVWEKRDLQRGFGMFPYFADASYFDAPPCRSVGA
jgi:hypothetical protein